MKQENILKNSKPFNKFLKIIFVGTVDKFQKLMSIGFIVQTCPPLHAGSITLYSSDDDIVNRDEDELYEKADEAHY